MCSLYCCAIIGEYMILEQAWSLGFDSHQQICCT